MLFFLSWKIFSSLSFPSSIVVERSVSMTELPGRSRSMRARIVMIMANATMIVTMMTFANAGVIVIMMTSANATMIVIMMTSTMSAKSRRTRSQSLMGRQSRKIFVPFCVHCAGLERLHLLHTQMDEKFYFQYAFSIAVVSNFLSGGGEQKI